MCVCRLLIIIDWNTFCVNRGYSFIKILSLDGLLVKLLAIIFENS